MQTVIQEQLRELLSDKNKKMWNGVLYGYYAGGEDNLTDAETLKMRYNGMLGHIETVEHTKQRKEWRHRRLQGDKVKNNRKQKVKI